MYLNLEMFIWLPLSLRASMEGYLDAYNPKTSVTPAGIFVSRVEVWYFINAFGLVLKF